MELSRNPQGPVPGTGLLPQGPASLQGDSRQGCGLWDPRFQIGPNQGLAVGKLGMADWAPPGLSPCQGLRTPNRASHSAARSYSGHSGSSEPGTEQRTGHRVDTTESPTPTGHGPLGKVKKYRERNGHKGKHQVTTTHVEAGVQGRGPPRSGQGREHLWAAMLGRRCPVLRGASLGDLGRSP